MKFDNLHQILRSLYEQMMPLCGDMAGVATGVGGPGGGVVRQPVPKQVLTVYHPIHERTPYNRL